jgi:hypothetical protein
MLREFLTSIDRRIRRKLLKWLLKDGIEVGNTITITSSYIDLERNTTDPSNNSGRLWWNDSEANLKVSDGSRAYALGSRWIDLYQNTTDPYLLSGRLWWNNSDLCLKISDGNRAYSIGPMWVDLLRNTSDPSLSSGRLWWNDSDKNLKVSDGTTAYSIGPKWIDLYMNTADPSLSSGRVWWREDYKSLMFSDGTNVFMLKPQVTFLGIRRGYYYGSFINATALTTLALSANILYAVPIIIQERSTWTGIAINVTSAGASGTKARLGIYSDNGSGYPSSLVVNAGEVTVDSTGVKELSLGSLTLIPGVYWLSICSSGAPTVLAVAPAGAIPILGTDLASLYLGWSISYTYGTLPSTFPSNASAITSNIPLIGLKRL